METVLLVSRRMNPGLKVTGIVLTMFDAQTKLSGEVLGDLNSFIESAKGKALPWAGARIFKSKIRRNIKLAESPSFGKTIIKYDPASNGAADYRALAKELLAMEGVAVTPGSVPAELRNAPSGQTVERTGEAVVATVPVAPVMAENVTAEKVTAERSAATSVVASSASPREPAAPAHPVTPSPFATAPLAPPFSRDPEDELQASPQGSAPAPVTPPAPAPKAKKPPKPKAAVLVSPAEAAKLKAAKIIPTSTEPAPEATRTES